MNGKSKGSSFERLIAKDFDKWWEEVSGTFWRTKISGGSDEPGDISPRYRPQHKEKPWWPFVIECKHYKSINLLNLFRNEKNKNNHILEWWRQVTSSQNQAIKGGYDPVPLRLLIIRVNTYPILCVFSLSEFLSRAKVPLYIKKLRMYVEIHRENEHALIVTCFEDFKKHFTKTFLEELFKK